MASYQSFAEIVDNDESFLIQVLPENKGGPRLWHQLINDLDYFFLKIYRYHQRSGFLCHVMSQILELFQFGFVVGFTVFLIDFVDYAILFKDKVPTGHPTGNKITLNDVILGYDQVYIGSLQIVLLICASLFWILKGIKVIQSAYVYYAIKLFYSEALHIQDCAQFSWQEVQTRLIQAQHLCSLQEGHLNELDIHNRILRHQNYTIALLNKNLLPIHYKVPLLGEVTYLSKGLNYNINLLLFRGPFAIFESSWKLKDDYKSAAYRQVCADQFSRNCLMLAAINFILMPLIFIWQILYIFYAYAETLKRDPSHMFASKNWSLYARIFCRHFNELDHQLNDRLNKGYKAASMYMDSFNSPLMEVIAKNVMFVAGAVLAVLVLLTIYDEDVIAVEHIITIMAGLGLVVAGARGFIRSDVPMKYSKSELHSHILQHIHYLPHRYSPHSPQAQSAMGKMFQYKIQAILEDLLSPLITPYILAVHLRLKALEYVDFFRNYTVEVSGTGDVCIFAMLNIGKNGNPAWEPDQQNNEHRQYNLKAARSVEMGDNLPTSTTVPENLVCENGKLELSLINFKLTNPTWKPSDQSQQQFIDCVSSRVVVPEVPTVEQECPVDLGRAADIPKTPHSSFVDEGSNLPSRYSRSSRQVGIGFSLDSLEMDEIDLTMSLTSKYLNDLATSRLSGPADSPSEQRETRSERDPLLHNK
ncbi:autophagy-related protein 9 [Brevipalpus obovatus]|uniref:autophagy-related protein 9 n=1 Tax=Brevipalpus obovatus TaxID=246614 RepID=UPI003D9E1024